MARALRPYQTHGTGQRWKFLHLREEEEQALKEESELPHDKVALRKSLIASGSVIAESKLREARTIKPTDFPWVSFYQLQNQT